MDRLSFHIPWCPVYLGVDAENRLSFRVPGLSVMPGIWHDVPESLKRVVKKNR